MLIGREKYVRGLGVLFGRAKCAYWPSEVCRLGERSKSGDEVC